MKNRDLVVLLLIIALVVLLLILLLMYFFKWKKEGNKMLQDKGNGASSANMEGVEFIDAEEDKGVSTVYFNSQKEQEKNDLTVIDHMTLKDTLRVLESDSLLSNLDDDLENVKKEKQTIEDHKKYFKTQVDKKLKQLCLMYSPNSPKWHSIPEEERPKAQAMQAKLNDIRSILKYFNENFSQYDDFKYSYFSKVRVDFLGNEETLKKTSHAVLNKLGELSYIKYEKLIPNLNGFLRSSQASMKGFTSNNFSHFLQEKNNAKCYFENYLSGYRELFANLKSFYELCNKDSCMKPIATQMLKECETQDKILIKVNNFLNQSQLQRQVLINSGYLINCEYPYCINSKQSYEQADEDFTLPFIEYINILAICNEIINKEIPPWKKTGSEISIVHYLISNKIYKAVADNEVIKNSNDLLSLHKLAHYLLTYYCYGDEKNGRLAAEFLHINSLDAEYALQLLVQVINVYSSCLEKEFQPEKDFYEKIAEVQMEFLKTMKGLCDEFCKKLEQYHEQFFEADLELHKANLEIHKQIHKQNSEFYQLASGFLAGRLELTKARIVKMEEVLNEKVPEGVREEEPNCSSSSQQQPANQADDQPGPSCKLDEVPPISRSQSLNSLHSNDSDIRKLQCR